MAWIKIDDCFTEHPKFLQAGPLAGYLNIAAIAWSNRNLTDGFIPATQVPRLVNFNGFAHHMWMGEICGGGDDATAEDLAAELVGIGLWDIVEGGYQIHDYHEWQTPAKDILALREKRVRAGRKGGEASQAKRQANAQALAKANSNQEVRSKKKEVLTPLSDSSDVARVFEHWKTGAGKNNRTVLSEKRRKVIRAALKDYPLDDVLDAVVGWKHSPHHRGENDRRTIYNKLEVLLRDADQIEMFRDLHRRSQKNVHSFAEAVNKRLRDD